MLDLLNLNFFSGEAQNKFTTKHIDEINQEEKRIQHEHYGVGNASFLPQIENILTEVNLSIPANYEHIYQAIIKNTGYYENDHTDNTYAHFANPHVKITHKLMPTAKVIMLRLHELAEQGALTQSNLSAFLTQLSSHAGASLHLPVHIVYNDIHLSPLTTPIFCRYL